MDKKTEKFVVGEKVLIADKHGNWHKGTIYNINFYREYPIQYAVDIDGLNLLDPIFCSVDKLKKIKGENEI